MQTHHYEHVGSMLLATLSSFFLLSIIPTLFFVWGPLRWLRRRYTVAGPKPVDADRTCHGLITLLHPDQGLIMRAVSTVRGYPEGLGLGAMDYLGRKQSLLVPWADLEAKGIHQVATIGSRMGAGRQAEVLLRVKALEPWLLGIRPENLSSLLPAVTPPHWDLQERPERFTYSGGQNAVFVLLFFGGTVALSALWRALFALLGLPML